MDFIVLHLMPGIAAWYGCCVLAGILAGSFDDKFMLLGVPPVAAMTGAMLWLTFQ